MTPFIVSKRRAEDELEWDVAERVRSRCVWVTGQRGLTEGEAAVIIVEEARRLLADDLSAIGVNWAPPATGIL